MSGESASQNSSAFMSGICTTSGAVLARALEELISDKKEARRWAAGLHSEGLATSWDSPPGML